jgi:hypothetical protein
MARPLPENRTARTQNKRTRTTMPQVGFEPAIPVLERATTVHALDRAAAVIGCQIFTVTPNRGKKSPWRPMYRRLVGPQSFSGLHEEQLNTGRQARNIAATPTDNYSYYH